LVGDEFLEALDAAQGKAERGAVVGIVDPDFRKTCGSPSLIRWLA
jgi:hypothetical protein